jgi:hypothetical protein
LARGRAGDSPEAKEFSASDLRQAWVMGRKVIKPRAATLGSSTGGCAIAGPGVIEFLLFVRRLIALTEKLERRAFLSGPMEGRCHFAARPSSFGLRQGSRSFLFHRGGGGGGGGGEALRVRYKHYFNYEH